MSCRARYAPMITLLAIFGMSSASAGTVDGDMRYWVDEDGRFAIALDEEVNGVTDGYADYLYLFSLVDEIDEVIDASKSEVTIDLQNDRILVDSDDGSVHIDLSILADPTHAGSGSITLRFDDGVEIVDHKLDNTVTLANMSTQGFESGLLVGWIWGGGSGYKTCDHGGEGATFCKIDEDSCQVRCKAGYYACCMDNFIFNDSCKCYKEPEEN